MIYTFTIPCFDLKQIAQSGQCFRMNDLDAQEMPEEAGWGYRVISRGLVLKVWQTEDKVSFECGQEALEYWLSYFDVERDYQAVIDSVAPEDTYLTAAAKAGKGIRILRQDPWEMIITFVISQQKTIPKIRELVEALCRSYGSPAGSWDVATHVPDKNSSLWAFPKPEQLGEASLEELQALKLGYRAKYIHRLCRDAVSGALDIGRLEGMDYDEAMDYLTGFYGIGRKVANCVCLFGLHHISAFPVDTWIEKILMEQYYNKQKYRRTPKTCLCEKIVKDCFGQYNGCAGIMQQYIFYYERMKQNKLA